MLLVSTDPASNVGQVFGLTIGNTITAVPDVPGLSALEIDPQQAADAYRARIIDPVRGLLPAAEVEAMTEQLSGACTTEIASFNEFTSLLADPDATAGYDHVLFDTAPTGHTIRLLQLPGEWTTYLSDGKGDVSCLGPVAGLDRLRHDYRGALDALTDPAAPGSSWSAGPQRSALGEAARTHTELLELGMSDAHLVVNGVMPHDVDGDPLAAAIAARESAALETMPLEPARTAPHHLALLPFNIVGLAALRRLLDRSPQLPGPRWSRSRRRRRARRVRRPARPRRRDRGGRPGAGHVHGQGRRGQDDRRCRHRRSSSPTEGTMCMLTTTDPAAHLTETLQADVGAPDRVAHRPAAGDHASTATGSWPGRATTSTTPAGPCSPRT